MHSLGIVKNKNLIEWTLLQKKGSSISILKTGEGSTIPEEILSLPDLTVVSGIKPDATLRRDLTLSVTSKKLAEKILPFQLEPLIPFSLEQSVIFPEYFIEEDHTFVTVWITDESSIKSHIQEELSLKIEADIISFQTRALSLWSRFFFPDTSQIALLFEKVAVVISHQKVIYASMIEDRTLTSEYLRKKFPFIPLFDLLERNYSQVSDTDLKFSTCIGLALETFQKDVCQIRTKEISSSRQSLKEKKRMRALISLGCAVCFTTWGVFFILSNVQERKLKKQLALSYSLPFASLESGIKSLRTEIIEELKKTPSYPHLVPLQDILAWISSLQLPIEIDRVEYELIDYPKEKRNTPYQGQLSLIFQASSPSVVSAVIKELQKNPSYVQQKDELKWTLHPQGYKISFLLQNSSLPQSIDGNLFPSESR